MTVYKRLKSGRGLLMIALLFGLVAIAPTTRSESFGDPIGNYNFRVEIDGVDAGQFTAVDGLSIEQEVIEFQNGDDPLTRKRPGRVKYSDITLKRGYVQGDPMWDWIQHSLNVAGEVERKSGALILENNSGEKIVRYEFFEAWPCKWKGFSLDGKGNDVLTEEITICIESFNEA